MWSSRRAAAAPPRRREAVLRRDPGMPAPRHWTSHRWVLPSSRRITLSCSPGKHKRARAGPLLLPRRCHSPGTCPATPHPGTCPGAALALAPAPPPLLLARAPALPLHVAPAALQVALLFLVKGPMRHEEVWRRWFSYAADLVPAPLLQQRLCSSNASSQQQASRGRASSRNDVGGGSSGGGSGSCCGRSRRWTHAHGSAGRRCSGGHSR